MTTLAIVIPAHNAAPTIGACLSALAEVRAHAPTVLVVDDGSTDGTADIARRHGADVLTVPGPLGPAAARNAGVATTAADLVLFVDADVVVTTEAVGRLVSAFASDRQLAAAFGSYDDRPHARNVVSLFKNLLHHFVHQQARERSTSFWAGFGAIRREAFEHVGGFAADRYRRPSIEDIELGARLWRAGRPVRLVKEAQVTHLKSWSFAQLVKTDVLRRAWPWSELLLSGEAPSGDLNLRPRDRLSAIAAWTTVGGLAALAAGFQAGFSMAMVAAAAIAVLNRDVYGFFARTVGWRFVPAACLLHACYYLYSSATFALCLLRRWLVPAGPADAPARRRAG